MPVMGTLYVVGTPIGNLEDITLRALRVLREVDVIACEDTRHAKTLLSRHGITTPLVSYHEHNERTRAPQLVRRLRSDENVALITDAGMPGISDPGFPLVTQAIEAGVTVTPIPGPSAVTAALSVAGLPSERFLFLGFLPRARAARRRALKEVASVSAALVIFEAPHRIRVALQDVAEVLGPRRVTLVREVTKLHEEIVRGQADKLAARLAETETAPRGEFTLVVEGAGIEPAARRKDEPDAYLRRLVTRGMSRRDAARTVAEAYGLPRREVYRLALEVKKP